MGIDHDPSLEHEPQWERRHHEVDPSEFQAQRVLKAESSHANLDDAVDHTVWDEPALSPEVMRDDSKPRLTYADWLDWRIETTSAARTWWITFWVALAAGPWAILGALFRSSAAGGWGMITLAVIAPVTEEVMKVAIALWIVEKRPYLFRWPAQILLCTLAGGLAFAAIENLMYLKVYIADPTQLLIVVRWTVCVTMHVSCSLLAGFGLVHVWSRAITNGVRPEVRWAAPWIVAAMCIHGAYNTMAVITQLSGWIKF